MAVKKKAKKECPNKAKENPHAGAKRVLQGHRRLWKSVKRRLSTGLKDGDEKELKLAKIAGDVLADVAKGEREAWGIEDNEFGEDEIDSFFITSEMERITVPPGAEKTVDRDKKV